jgi:hypothetical protein
MCLLFQKPANVTFTDEHLRDFFTFNRDGYGVMYAEGGKLFMRKELGNVDQWIAFFRTHEHREACFHLRMKTHGDVDLVNCHPYPVFGFEGEEAAHPMLLMHNGILSTGNERDRSKSDTWHYIRDYIRTLLKNDPALAFDPVFADVIGKHIGQNRFAIMDHTGKTAIINKAQGVEFNGAWLSNTYAWSHTKYMPSKYSGHGSGIHYGVNIVYRNGEKGSLYKGSWISDKDFKALWAAQPGKSTGGTNPHGGKKKRSRAKPGSKLQDKTYLSLANSVVPVPRPDYLPTRTTSPTGVPAEWVDDVLEIRSQLDASHIENTTRDRQIVQMLDVMGPQKVYEALELLQERAISTKYWDCLTASVLEMREFTRHCKQDYLREPDEWVTQ